MMMPDTRISALLSERIAAGEFPSAVWLVAKRGEIVSQGAVGFAVKDTERVPASLDTIYDLASLTKPLAGALLAAILSAKGEIAMRDAVGQWVSGFESGEKDSISIEDLLAHRSGFESWRPFYLEVAGTTRRERLRRIVEKISSLKLEYPPHTRVIYSDLNFLLLTYILESVFGGTLEEAAGKLIFEPLGLESTFFDPPASAVERCAASETGNEYERITAAERGFDVEGYKWRKGPILGEVHDGNCHFLGGIAAHAGLFATAKETLRMAEQFLPGRSKLLEPKACEAFCENLTPGLEQDRSSGFQLASTRESTAYEILPANAFGHLGFTGTMLWIDPLAERIYILLTNRTHGRNPPFADLRRTRRQFLTAASHIAAE